MRELGSQPNPYNPPGRRPRLTYMKNLWWIVTMAVLALLAAGWVVAQDSGSDEESGVQPDIYMETLEVSVVNVDVYVTDKQGNPITGLTKDDFEVYEDRKPMSITNFYAVEGGKPVTPPEEAEAVEETPAPQIPSLQPQPSIPLDQRLHLIIYIDNFNIHPFNRNRVLREVRQFLNEYVTRDDRVMLVSYDRSLHIRRPFTSDPTLIASALSELEKLSGHMVHHDSERRDILARVEDSQSEAEALGWVRTYAESVYHDLSFTIDALREMVNSLAGLPGRKAVLYVSDGLPMIAGQDVFHAIEQKFGRTTALTEAFSYDASRRFRELAAQANANRVTFYTIDAAGLRVYSSISAAEAGPGPGLPGSATFIESIRFSNLQATLHFLADQTGGMAVVNANRVLPYLERIAQDFNTYYSLGYRPPRVGDGRYRKIEVRLKGKPKGVTVRHREGYRSKTPEAQMADSILSVLYYGFEDNPMGIDLDFGRAVPREGGHYLVPIRVRIPLDKLVLVPLEEFHEARLRLFLAAMDEEGGMSPVQQAQVPIRIPSQEVDEARQKYYVYALDLLMRRGGHKVAVGLRDDIGSVSSFISRNFHVGG